MSKANLAVLEAYYKGYRVNEVGELVSPSGNKPRGGIGTVGYRRFGIRERNSGVIVWER